ncbi:MAG TPA: rhodanese-like domain-containing protein [Methanobacterium sp.]|nr:rhodanese-like domain-containing protein [Methanobacterium sp.]
MSIFKKSKKKVEELEPKEAFTEIEKHHDNPDFIVLDVRTPKEYNKEHLENAEVLDFKSSNFKEELEKMDPEKNYYVYCRSGRRSLKAVEQMKKQGFQKVFNIKGGINKWKSKRLPLTAD